MLLVSPLANLFIDCLASYIIVQLGKVNRSSVNRFLSICTWTGTSVCVTTAGLVFGMEVSEAEKQNISLFSGTYKKPQSETRGNERTVHIYPKGANEWEQPGSSLIITFSYFSNYPTSLQVFFSLTYQRLWKEHSRAS